MTTLRHTLTAILFCIVATLPLAAQEQTKPVFGYISYTTVIQQMPEYAEAQQKFAELKAKYDAEATRSEEEFQRKFSEFLQGQKDFPRSILQKRQTELQDLMERSVAFRSKAQQLLADAQTELQQPAEKKLHEAINAVATRMGLLFVINTDNNACPFVNQQAGINLYELVMQQLGLASPLTATP